MPKIKITTVSLPEDWHAAFTAAAKAREQSLSDWMTEQCKAALPKSTARKLSQRKGRGAPRKTNGA